MVRRARLCCAALCLVARRCRRLTNPGASACVLPPQIRFILLQNRQGRTRLAKYYVPLDDGEKRKLETDIHRLVVNRDPLDLVWHFHKVYMILDEFILGGEIQETSKQVILDRMEELSALEGQEGGLLDRLT